MYVTPLRQPIQINTQKKFWRTYLVCAMVLTTLGIANMVASVHSMYSTNTSQELEYKRSELTQRIRELEQQKAQSTNLMSVQQLAEQQGYSPVEQVLYVETPNTQIVAQR